MRISRWQVDCRYVDQLDTEVDNKLIFVSELVKSQHPINYFHNSANIKCWLSTTGWNE
jgi:hypothetical protein